MSYSIYQLELPEQPEAVVFVNGFVARDLSGFLWVWRNLIWIREVTDRSEGCVQVKAGICGPNEVVMVSYWRNEDSLKRFFRGEAHRRMMDFVKKRPNSLCLYNETYSPARSGKYSHEPQGLATIYRATVRS